MTYSTPKLLTANNAWGMLANMLVGTTRFVVLLILARCYPVATMGQIALAWAVVTPAAYLVLMEVRMVFVTDTERRISHEQYFSLRLVASGFYMLLLSGTACVLRLFRSELDPVFLVLCGAIRLGECWADMYLAVPQERERMHLLVLSYGIRLAGVLAVLGVAVAAGSEVRWVLTGWLTVVWLIVLLLDRRLARPYARFAWSWRPDQLRLLLKRAWPLGLYLALVGVNANMGRYVLAAHGGAEEVGFLWALMLIVPIAVMAQAGVNQALLPRLALQRQDDVKSFHRTIVKMVCLTSSVVVVVWLISLGFGSKLLGIIFGSAYAAYGHLLDVAVILAGVSVVGAIVGDAVVAAQQYRNRALMVGLGLVVNAAVCFWAIPIWQIRGALIAALCGATVRVLLGLVYLLRR